jgi:hypothetical protein
MPEEIYANSMQIRYLMHEHKIIDSYHEPIRAEHIYVFITFIATVTPEQKEQYWQALRPIYQLFRPIIEYTNIPKMPESKLKPMEERKLYLLMNII